MRKGDSFSIESYGWQFVDEYALSLIARQPLNNTKIPIPLASFDLLSDAPYFILVRE